MSRLGLVFLLTASIATAGEYAVLGSGARLHVDRHEADGAKIRLYHAGGFVEMDTAAVKAFEQEEVPVPQPVAGPAVAVQSGGMVEAPPRDAKPTTPMTPMEMADAAADRYGLPRSLVRSVMSAESGYQVDALSPKGAIGLMQLMPGTAQLLGVDPYDPAQNVDAGVRHLRALLEKYNGGLWHALAAYNAGPGAVEKYNGVPPYRETINYIGTIQRKMKKADAAAVERP